MKFEIVEGQVVREKNRFGGDPFDTVILDVISGSDGETYPVKVRLDKWGLSVGSKYSFFGVWSSYLNKYSGLRVKQFGAWTYCIPHQTDAVVDLMHLLLGRRFPRELASRLVYEWGDKAREIVERNPYALMQFPRCGFRLTDKLYLDLGKPKNAIKRQTLCAAYDLGEYTDGSTWHAVSRAEHIIQSSIENSNPTKAIALGVRAGLLATTRTDGYQGPLHWDGDCEWIATGIEARWEHRLASMLADFSSCAVLWPGIHQGGMSDHQYDQLLDATEGPVGILLGCAGSGKTFTAAQVIKACTGKKILIGAPTGKAAVRLSEALAESGVKERARTNHSILGYNGSRYAYNEHHKLDVDVLFVDESSMVDLEMMFRLFSALEPGTLVLFIGDPYQLPPVGAGAPLRDMAKFLPTGTLTEVRRNAGAIVLAGAAIRDGNERFEVYHESDGTPETNLVMKTARDEARQLQSVLECYDEAIEHGYDPLWDIQVITIVRQDSQLGANSLNLILQKHLNSNPSVKGTPFRIGDKVMQTKNSWMLPKRKADKTPDIDEDAILNGDGCVYVANGEMGIVTHIDFKSITIRMTQPRRVVVAYRQDIDEEESEPGMTGSSFVLAYAITTHKSQGSQVPIAIFVLDEHAGARRMLDRSLLYTAITRAKTKTILVGKEETAQAACRRASISSRKTFLRELFEAEAGKSMFGPEQDRVPLNSSRQGNRAMECQPFDPDASHTESARIEFKSNLVVNHNRLVIQWRRS